VVSTVAQSRARLDQSEPGSITRLSGAIKHAAEVLHREFNGLDGKSIAHIVQGYHQDKKINPNWFRGKTTIDTSITKVSTRKHSPAAAYSNQDWRASLDASASKYKRNFARAATAVAPAPRKKPSVSQTIDQADASTSAEYSALLANIEGHNLVTLSLLEKIKSEDQTPSRTLAAGSSKMPVGRTIESQQFELNSALSVVSTAF